MVEENPHDPTAKRQRLETEQRTAYEEDIARVRAAGGTQNQSGVGNSNSVGQSDAGESTAENTNMADSDAEDGGNWLKKFTTRHTRIGENYQVTDLPVPSPKKR